MESKNTAKATILLQMHLVDAINGQPCHVMINK